jgi:hypothetical protein
MEQQKALCCCGWIGDDFSVHHKETEFEDRVHVETSILMELFLQKESP